MIFRMLTGISLALVCSAGPSFAVTLAVDENGQSSFGAIGTLREDPGPGGLPAVLTYTLPFSVVAGDVLLSGESDGNQIFDVVRFNSVPGGPSTLVFYSDNVPPADSLGDTPSPPAAFYTNTATALEVGTEAANSATYSPSAGQPGFNESQTALTYQFVSDGRISTPEPSSLVLLAIGVLSLSGFASRRCRSR
jgi:PEP-CTERM motif